MGDSRLKQHGRNLVQDNKTRRSSQACFYSKRETHATMVQRRRSNRVDIQAAKGGDDVTRFTDFLIGK
ncbi:hypothetical protein G6F43_014488 [Rhizopus delemar]|nr:hypothetical protein G6F43_014488 [Rhizopus delemar]